MIADETTVTRITLNDLSILLNQNAHVDVFAGQELVVTKGGIDLFKIVPLSGREQETANGAPVPAGEDTREPPKRRRHPITMENSREETIRRMRSFPERAAKFRETLRALRETNSR